jgi:hypothetical protein
MLPKTLPNGLLFIGVGFARPEFCVLQCLFLTFRRTDMAVNKPISDNARKGAVREHPQLDTEINSGMPGRRTP